MSMKTQTSVREAQAVFEAFRQYLLSDSRALDVTWEEVLKGDPTIVCLVK